MTENMYERKIAEITAKKGGYREKWILKNPHAIEKSETWNDEHKVIHIIELNIDPYGHSDSYSIDLVTESICG